MLQRLKESGLCDPCDRTPAGCDHMPGFACRGTVKMEHFIFVMTQIPKNDPALLKDEASDIRIGKD